MPQYNLITRRRLIQSALGAFAGFGAVSASKSILLNRQLQALDNPSRDFTVTEYCSLKECARDKGLIYGASALYNELISDPEFAGSICPRIRNAGARMGTQVVRWR